MEDRESTIILGLLHNWKSEALREQWRLCSDLHFRDKKKKKKKIKRAQMAPSRHSHDLRIRSLRNKYKFG